MLVAGLRYVGGRPAAPPLDSPSDWQTAQNVAEEVANRTSPAQNSCDDVAYTAGEGHILRPPLFVRGGADLTS